MTAGEVGAAYDERSREYVERFGRLDQHAVADLELVGRWAASTSGPLLDAGCGPGQWVEVLGRGGREVVGLDVSEQFLTIARRSRPGVLLLRASVAALPLRPESFGGVLAWYSVIHTPPAELATVLVELRRVLQPGGSLLLGFVDGDSGQPFAHAVVTAYAWSVEVMQTLLSTAGFEVVEHHRRRDPGLRPHAALIAYAR